MAAVTAKCRDQARRKVLREKPQKLAESSMLAEELCHKQGHAETRGGEALGQWAGQRRQRLVDGRNHSPL